jgi:hypothetical protein
VKEEKPMAWHLTGQLIEACSCKSVCPCTLGAAEPDQGWCSGALTFAIQQGQSDGVNLGGRTVVWLVDLPKDFVGGNGTVRIYVDDGADASQMQELEAIFTGRKGGPGEVLKSLVTKWLPTQKAKIAVQGGDNPSVTVGAVGHVTAKRISDDKGRVAKLVNAPVLGAIQVETLDLARGDGTRFADPDMRRWESGGHAGLGPFSWRVA